MNYTDKSWKVPEGGSWDFFMNSRIGTYITKHGTVEILLDGDHMTTSLSLIINGTAYERCYEKRYSYQYAVTLAKRFAKEKWDEYKQKSTRGERI